MLLSDYLSSLILAVVLFDAVEDLQSLAHEKEGSLEDVKSSSINTLTAKGKLSLRGMEVMGGCVL